MSVAPKLGTGLEGVTALLRPLILFKLLLLILEIYKLLLLLLLILTFNKDFALFKVLLNLLLIILLNLSFIDNLLGLTLSLCAASSKFRLESVDNLDFKPWLSVSSYP